MATFSAGNQVGNKQEVQSSSWQSDVLQDLHQPWIEIFLLKAFVAGQHPSLLRQIVF